MEVVCGRTRGRRAGGGARTGVSLKESTVSLDWMEKEVTLGTAELSSLAGLTSAGKAAVPLRSIWPTGCQLLTPLV